MAQQRKGETKKWDRGAKKSRGGKGALDTPLKMKEKGGEMGSDIVTISLIGEKRRKENRGGPTGDPSRREKKKREYEKREENQEGGANCLRGKGGGQKIQNGIGRDPFRTNEKKRKSPRKFPKTV